MVRNVVDPAHAKATVPLAGAGRLHKIVDPDAGDALTVVTATAAAARLHSAAGLRRILDLGIDSWRVVQPNAEESSITVDADSVMLSRPGGLTLSAAISGRSRMSIAVKPLFDLHKWQENEEAPFIATRDALIRKLAEAPGTPTAWRRVMIL